MNYDEEFWLKVYTRDTPSWLALSWQARGLALEIARKLPKNTGELSLGRKGLPALAALVRADWDDIEEFVMELIADGRLVHDPERQVILDPQHVERQGAVTSGAERTRRWRETKVGVTESHAVTSHGDAVTSPGHTVTSHGDAVTDHVTPVCHAVTNRRDQKRSEEIRSEIPDMSPLGTEAGEVWEHYIDCLRRHRPKRRPGALRPEDRKAILVALRTRTIEDVKAACTGLFRSSHHLGMNDRDTEYLAIKYALRNLDSMIALADEHEPPADTPVHGELVDPAMIDALLESLNGIGAT